MTLGLNNKNGVTARKAEVPFGYSGLEGESGSVLASLGEMTPQ